MPNEYVQLDDLKATLDLATETFADADITRAIAAASRAIEDICARRFWLDADAEQVRYYTARSRKLLEVDDLVVLTSLLTDSNGDGVFEQTWAVNSDFVLEPLNAAADIEPYTAIRRHPNGSFRFPGSLPRGVKVTGQFGWPAVPDGIVEATGILATRLLRRSREAPFGVIGFALEQGAAVASLARNDPDVMMLAGPYIRILML